MYVHELGRLEGEVLLFGGPYSNLAAIKALIELAQRRDIPACNMICTGDVVAYCGSPSETVATIRRLGCPVVAGNCEKQLANGQMDCGCGFEEGSTCDLLSAGWFAHADRAIGQDDRNWMGELPDVITFEHHDQRFAVIHGGIQDISRFIWETSSTEDFVEEIDYIQALVGPVNIVLAGHSGLPFQRQIGDKTWLNAGVIGMPPHDGQAQTRYVLLNHGEATIERLTYEYENTISDMSEKGLTQGYHKALRSGYWPSEDVLPPELRRSALESG